MKIKKMLKRFIDKNFIKKPKLREVFTLILYGTRDVEVNIFGVKLKINKLKENGYFRASKKIENSSLLEHEIPVVMSLISQMQDGGCFVDVGANVGVFSSVFAKSAKLFNGFSTLAFEVNPETFLRLKANASSNGFEAFNFGISNSEKKIKFVEGAVSHVTTTIEKKNQYSIKERIFWAECKPLDMILKDKKDIILKIDVEGQENDVLDGARHLFETKRIKAIYIDGYDDPAVWKKLNEQFYLFDGRTLHAANETTFCLLGLRKQ